MSDTELTRISTLLARRDGEPRDAAEPAALSAEDEAELALLTELKGAVQALPDVPVSDTWRHRLPAAPTSSVVTPTASRAWRWHRYPLASAAAAFLVSVAAVLLINTVLETPFAA